MKRFLMSLAPALSIATCLSQIAHAAPNCSVSGELKRWHKVAVNCTGPNTSEGDSDNPFLNYRMDVIFSFNGNEMRVPGFYAADGRAQESSASSGNVWRAILSPPAAGTWNYRVSFRQGANVAISLDPNEGSPVHFDGETGIFSIAPTDKTGRDFRATGRAAFVEQRYQRFTETGDFFLKSGVDSPENLLAYADFDQTTGTHKYAPHAGDWKSGDPTWKGGRGKNIIGAMNYLASRGINSSYFLTYSVDGGDSGDVWMWTSSSERTRFDVSKLAQWDMVFDHMDHLGIGLHVVTQETENDDKLSGGTLGTHRKLYYRELVARFAHHLNVMWNLGEEFSLPAARAAEFAAYIKALDPYPNPVVVHTYPGKGNKEKVYAPLLGNGSLDGASLQVNIDKENNNGVVAEWISRSEDAGRKWMVQHDETGPVRKYCLPDSETPQKYSERSKVIWGTFFGGGAGVEWIFFTKSSADLKAENFRSYQNLYTYTGHAVNFMRNYLPFWTMRSNNGLTSAAGDYVFANNDTFAVYLPRSTSTTIDLPSGNFTVDWYDPRSGGGLQKGSVTQVSGGSGRALGNPPNSPSEDWVVLVRRNGSAPLPTPTPTPPPSTPTPTPTPTPTVTTTPAPNPTGVPYRITKVSLYDDVKDEVIAPYTDIRENGVIDLNQVASQNLNLLVETEPKVVGSVRFKLNSGKTRSENTAPYTAFNENTGTGFATFNADATHTLVAQAYSGSSGSGTAGPMFTLHFRTVKKGGSTPPASTPTPTPTPTVTSTPTPTPTPTSTSAPSGDFEAYIYDESTKAPVPGIPALRNGIQIDFRPLEGKPLNIMVRPLFSGAKSMSFSYRGGSFRNENEAPFTVLKETGSGNSVLAPGDHSFVARAHSAASGGGSVLNELRMSFTFTEGPDVKAPVITSTVISGRFKVNVSFNEEAQVTLKYAKKFSGVWHYKSSPEFKMNHVIEVTDAEEEGWAYRIVAQDRLGNSAETPDRDLVTPKMIFPGAQWTRATPEQVGVSSNAVRDALAYMNKEIGGSVANTAIVRNGYLIHAGSDSTQKVWAASCTKSFTSTVLGVLIDQGKLTLNDRASKYIPELGSRYPNVELRHFATMTSGYDAEGGSYGYSGMDGSGTPFKIASPSFAPGTHFAYWDDAMNEFGHTMSRAIKENFSNVFKREIGAKIGMNNYTWNSSWSSGGIPISSGAGSGAGPIQIGAQDMARFCHLMLNRGNWDGQQLVSEAWVREATRVQVPASLPVHKKTQGWIGVGAYGYNWWVNGKLPNGSKLWPDVPDGAFAARGTRGNMCVVVPSWNMVFVRMGTGGSSSQSVINGTLKLLGQGLQN